MKDTNVELNWGNKFDEQIIKVMIKKQIEWLDGIMQIKRVKYFTRRVEARSKEHRTFKDCMNERDFKRCTDESEFHPENDGGIKESNMSRSGCYFRNIQVLM